MCGTFPRDLRSTAQGQLALQAFQAQQAAAAQQAQAAQAAASAAAQQQQQAAAAAVSAAMPAGSIGCLPLDMPQELKREGQLDDANDLFNWNLIDEQFGELEANGLLPGVSGQDLSTGQDLYFQQAEAGGVPNAEATAAAAEMQCTTTTVWNSGDNLPVYSMPSGYPQPAGGTWTAVKQEPATKSTTGPASTAPPSTTTKNTKSSNPKSNAKSKIQEKGPYLEKLPKDLLNHPCAATLLSAGIRIKGRTREELIEVAERIKKRRRASAARCRARKATHINHLEDENNLLKDENTMLKRKIVELTGGRIDLGTFLAMDPAQFDASQFMAQAPQQQMSPEQAIPQASTIAY